VAKEGDPASAGEELESWHKKLSGTLIRAISGITDIVPGVILNSGIMLVAWTMMIFTIILHSAKTVFTGNDIDQAMGPIAQVMLVIGGTMLLANGGQELITRMTTLVVGMGITGNHAIHSRMGGGRFECTGGEGWEIIEAGILYTISEAMDIMALGISIAGTALPFTQNLSLDSKWQVINTVTGMILGLGSLEGLIVLLRLLVGGAIMFYSGKIAITLLSRITETLLGTAIQICLFPITLSMAAFQSTRGSMGLLPKAAGQAALSFLMISISLAMVRYFVLLGTKYYMQAVYGAEDVILTGIPQAINALIATHASYEEELFSQGSVSYIGGFAILTALLAANAIVSYSFQVAAELIQGPQLESGGIQKLGQAAQGVTRGLRQAAFRGRR